MLGYTVHIPWDDIGQGIPAFLTIIIMPFTYSGGWHPGLHAVVESI
jgi:xanthine/uracil/vitamin C permease (AzgA family)